MACRLGVNDNWLAGNRDHSKYLPLSLLTAALDINKFPLPPRDEEEEGEWSKKQINLAYAMELLSDAEQDDVVSYAHYLRWKQTHIH